MKAIHVITHSVGVGEGIAGSLHAQTDGIQVYTHRLVCAARRALTPQALARTSVIVLDVTTPLDETSRHLGSVYTATGLLVAARAEGWPPVLAFCYNTKHLLHIRGAGRHCEEHLVLPGDALDPDLCTPKIADSALTIAR